MTKNKSVDTDKLLERARWLLRTEEVREYLFYVGLSNVDKLKVAQMWDAFYRAAVESEEKALFDEMRGVVAAMKSGEASQEVGMAKVADIRHRNRLLMENKQEEVTPTKFDPELLRQSSLVREYISVSEVLDKSGNGVGFMAEEIFEK